MATACTFCAGCGGLRPDLPVIVLCLPEDAARKMEAIRLGAQEVLVRPFEEAKLESVSPALPGRQRKLRLGHGQ